MVDPVTKKKLKAESEKTGKSIGTILDDLVARL